MNGRFLAYGVAIGTIIAFALMSAGCADPPGVVVTEDMSSKWAKEACDTDRAKLTANEACVKDVGCHHDAETYLYIEHLRQIINSCDNNGH